MKLRRFLLALLCLLALSLLVPMATLADLGPKPYTRINFTGLRNKNCYVTLLSRTSQGPYNNIYYGDNARYHPGDKEYKAWQKFVDYSDKDHYSFFQFVQKIDSNGLFQWSYLPPPKFKILIYFPDTDTLAVSDKVYEEYAFISYYTVDLSHIDPAVGGTFHAVRNYAGLPDAIPLLSRMFATILIELGVAWIFGFRAAGQVAVIVVTNVITQLLLNISLNLVNYRVYQHSVYQLHYLWLEVGVTVVEAVIYALTLNRLRRPSRYNVPNLFGSAGPDDPNPPVKIHTAVFYSLAANSLSYLAGFVLARAVPDYFWY